RILETAGNGLTQARHPHALFLAGIVSRDRTTRRGRSRRLGGRSRNGRGRSSGSGLGQRGKNVFLENLTSLAGTGDRGGVEALFIDQLLGGRSRSAIGCGDRLGGRLGLDLFGAGSVIGRSVGLGFGPGGSSGS